jgi:hypothetical protein
MTVDKDGQWFVYASVQFKQGGKAKDVEFKVDSGANVILLSKSTLKKFGFDASADSLSKLPNSPATVGSGSEVVFKSLGKVRLYRGDLYIGNFKAICHPKRETHDLLGSNVLGMGVSLEFLFRKQANMSIVRREI